MRKKVVYILYLVVVILVSAEILLRIYNPFSSSVEGDNIVLPLSHKYVFHINSATSGLDSVITVQKNQLGFRGPEFPYYSDELKIVAIGGSTTECILVSNGKTWEDVLLKNLEDSLGNIWLNNAGLDGHSTFGHLILLNKHVLRLKPDVCLFLVGANDVGRTDLNVNDSSIVKKLETRAAWLAGYSKLAGVLLNLHRRNRAREFFLSHERHFSSMVKKPALQIPDSVINKSLQQHKVLVQQYGDRLRKIISLCRANKIEPVFITQPCLLGEGIDDLTGYDLATVRLNDDLNGKLIWRRMELYNRQTQLVANENNVFLIDLAHLLPKSSRYFYDAWHYNNEGCRKIGEIMTEKLYPFLKSGTKK